MKYIIDIPDDSINKYVSLCDRESFVVPITVGLDSSLCFNTGLKLKPYTEPDRKAIEDAQNQGWKFANDIINGLNIYERRECFGYGLLPDILNSMSYQEAVEHFETWKTERNDLIKVGDEVVYSSNRYNYDVKGVVLSPETDDEYAVILTSDKFRRVVAANTDLKKTGRHFSQVSDLLKEMKGECDEVCD